MSNESHTDGILRVVSETMRSGLRPSDFLGRWTDDQFLAILMDCGVAGMEEAGARMRKVVGCAGLQWWRDELSATISLGYSAAQTGDTMESLLERAQRSLEEKSASCVLAASAGNEGRSKELNNVCNHRHRRRLQRGSGRLPHGARQP